MSILKIFLGLAIFLLGFVCALFLNYYSNYSFEKPYLGGEDNNAVSPPDYLSEDNIYVYPDKVVLRISGASISNYASTGSMKPILDEGTNGIRIKPKSEEDIKVGSIITFKSGSDLIVHRVIKSDKDENGAYFITKGDNSDLPDGKVRFSQIEYITIGLLY